RFAIAFFFSSRRRHTRSYGDWSSDVCSSDLAIISSRCSRPYKKPLRLAETKARINAGSSRTRSLCTMMPLLTAITPQSAYENERSEERRVGKEGRLRESQ